MKLKNIITDDYVTVYELNRSIQAPTMYGAMLYKGQASLLQGQILERKVFRLFGDYGTYIIVY